MDKICTYIDTLPTYVDTIDFTVVMRALTDFFTKKGYVEDCTQNRLSICTGCEDPTNVSVHEYGGKIWPMIQTGQMWLEWTLLTDKRIKKGVYCRTTSYREEKNPVPDRHYQIFPMFEFESFGTKEDLKKLETELLIFLGYQAPTPVDYEELATLYGQVTIENEHEARMCEEINVCCLLEDFPRHTNPFWNMAVDLETGKAKKIDVIMSGMETIGSAERSCDNEHMAKMFYELCDGKYHQLFFEKFGKDRTEAELQKFLELEKVPRFGGGIGMTRLIRSLKKEGLMDNLYKKYLVNDDNDNDNSNSE